MTWIEAMILGLVQGLTEFLPVSSSGHLEIGKVLLNVEVQDDLTFTVIVHFATVMSTITVFYADIRDLTRGLFAFRWNAETQYVLRILVSMIPVLVVGIFFREEVESLFSGNLRLVGIALLFTAGWLISTHLVKPGEKKIPFIDAFLIGIAQAVAVVPGISRSGATISAGLLLRNARVEVARFSFLMVLIPIIGATLLDIIAFTPSPEEPSVSVMALIIGFFSAYLSGLLACRWMIRLVKRGNLFWFAIYCALVGIFSIFLA
jgi:undecaprenyl-diphosphatase